MRYRKLDSDGDYSFGNGQLDFWRDVPQAVGQAAQTRLQLWLGEWFLNTEEGTPYAQGVFGKNKKETADLTIQQRVLGTEGLVEIESFESEIDPDTRVLTVTDLTINTIYGTTAVELENFNNY